MQSSKRRKLKFLLNERITVNNSSPSVHRRERSPPRKAGSQEGGAARPTSSALSSSEANRSRWCQEGESARGLAGAGGLRLPDPRGPRTGKSPGPGSRSRETTQAADWRRSRQGKPRRRTGSALGDWHLAHTHPEADSPAAPGCRGARRAAARRRESH